MLQLLLRKLTTAFRLLRESPPQALQKLLPRYDSYIITVTEVSAERKPPPLPGLVFRKLTDEELLSAANGREEFASSKEFLTVVGLNCAYGALLNGTVVAVIWLLTPGSTPEGTRLLKLEKGQAERAQIVTREDYRGRGIMPWAFAELNRIAPSMGVRECLSVIESANASSLRAIEKAGGIRMARVYRLVGPPFLGFHQWVIRREIKTK